MKTLFTLLLSVGIFTTCINAVTIYSYTNATDGSYNLIANNIAATNLTAVNGAILPTTAVCLKGFSTLSYGKATVFATTLDGVEFTITPNAGYRVSINGISAGMRRSGAGPANVRYTYKIGSGAFIYKGSDDFPNNSTTCTLTVGTSWSGLNINTSEQVTFRFYGFNASAGTGTFQLKDILVTGDGVLPVELTHFETKAKPQSILLSWKTASEKDNDYFNVEHSTTGFDFKTIHQIKGNGTTLLGATYSYEHPTPSVKNNYYRLKQVDFDGKYAYSPVKHIAFNKKKWFIASTIVHDFLNVETNGESSFNYIIINIVGSIVLKGNLNTSEKVDISQLNNGVYIFQTEYGEFERFIKN